MEQKVVKRVPYAFRPKKQMYVATALLLEDDRYLNMSRKEFVYEMIKMSPALNIKRANIIYDELMEDAGLSPL